MEYIQCSHCQKKYSVSDKIRSAIGKKIRCKGCEQTFEIIVIGDEQEQAPLATPTATEKPPKTSLPSTRQPTPQKQKKIKSSLQSRVKEKRNKRFTLIMVILSLLMVISIASLAYLYIEKPEVFQSWTKKMHTEEEQALAVFEPPQDAKPQPLLPQPPSAPDKLIASAQESMMGPSLPPTTATVGPPLPVIEPKTYRDMVDASKACAHAAAQQWMVDYLISHMRYSNKQYIQMLDQSSEHSSAMRQQCKDKALIHEITASAREGKKPFWIQAAVDAMQKQQLDEALKSDY